MPAELEGFSIFDFTDEDYTRPVYLGEPVSAPAVVLIHELPGMVPECVELGRRLCAAGYRVYMPLLFGRANASLLEMPAYLTEVCIRREFTLLAKGKSSGVTNWLRALCRRAKQESGAAGVGVIGMCLTGGFALSLMADDSVLAPVLSQPSLPLALGADRKRRLDISDEDLVKVAERVRDENLEVLGLRFTGDRMCPPEKFDTLTEAFGDRFLRVEIDSSPGNPHGNRFAAHSVLTIDYRHEEGHPTYEAYQTMLKFFERHLSGA